VGEEEEKGEEGEGERRRMWMEGEQHGRPKSWFWMLVISALLIRGDASE